ncbi:unnamed protein product [Acanthosepion pharaonis]|uniref:Uncharacterized protein n=1 Tax=Acanthosepion pharaonis TaxID=158019 RepID=A0A812DFG7_ACAPH|nr:unnamed protein product [Sepia pharaonis]
MSFSLLSSKLLTLVLSQTFLFSLSCQTALAFSLSYLDLHIFFPLVIKLPAQPSSYAHSLCLYTNLTEISLSLSTQSFRVSLSLFLLSTRPNLFYHLLPLPPPVHNLRVPPNPISLFVSPSPSSPTPTLTAGSPTLVERRNRSNDARRHRP